MKTGIPFSRILAALAALFGCTLAGAPATAQEAAPQAQIAPSQNQRPNVLVIFADDQRADTIAALGNPIIKTPNLDRLARRGLAFDRAYMQGGCNGATCVPSRAMLLSGQDVFHVDQALLKTPTWPTAFAKEGYTTFMTGKWHNGDAGLPKSFQSARAVVGGMGDGMTIKMRDLVDGKLVGRKHPAGQHACAIIADEAVRFLKDRTAQDAPFFFYLPFDAPHDPHIVPADFPVRYDPEQLPLPANFLPQHPFDNGELGIRDENLLPHPRSPQAVRKLLADYYRYVSYLDMQVGRVLDALDASPCGKNTLVVFSADSGAARGSHGLIGKQNLYEHSVRVPLIVAGPGIPEGKKTEAMCYLFDLLPTLGEICHVPAPHKIDGDGIPFNAVLKNPEAKARPDMFFAYKGVQRAVSTQEWKLIRYPKVDRTQLFDLKNDPQETHDLSGQAECAAKKDELLALLKKKMAESKDNGGEWIKVWIQKNGK